VNVTKHQQQANSELHEDQLLNFLVNQLDEEVTLNLANNAEIDREDIHEVLVGATADGTSISTLCNSSQESPSANTILYHLRKDIFSVSHTTPDSLVFVVGGTSRLLQPVEQFVCILTDLRVQPVRVKLYFRHVGNQPLNGVTFPSPVERRRKVPNHNNRVVIDDIYGFERL